ncbi:hypothetical protein GJAV_G00104750 [Gymnothorax javanicus]|nr:hypothetical protein GJAV_G00104750 [Gymnothorax javanicus]
MHWLTGHLLPVCVIGVLLLHYSPAQEAEFEDYDDYYRNGITEKPDYDYNVTYDYIFFSNTSGGTQDLEKYLRGGGKKHIVADAHGDVGCLLLSDSLAAPQSPADPAVQTDLCVTSSTAQHHRGTETEEV